MASSRIPNPCNVRSSRTLPAKVLEAALADVVIAGA